MRRFLPAVPLSASLGALLLTAAGLGAQSLHGSPASVERMFDQARGDGLEFFETASGIKAAVAEGDVVRLEPNADFILHDVSQPYAKPSTIMFVTRLASQYRQACHQQLVVTSTMRPEANQPKNSSELSVHPTGIAVDLRKPSGTCLTWLRKNLLALEQKGVIEATEERRPAHFHVAVFPRQYMAYLAEPPAALPQAKPGTAVRVADASSPTRYVVRRGDSLWSIAQHNDVTVEALRAANALRGSTIRAGQAIVLPSSR